MAKVNFENILSAKLGEIERPKPQPEGSYNNMIVDYEFSESARNHTPCVIFHLRPIEAGPDVDVAALEEFGPLTEAKGKVTFYLEEGNVGHGLANLQEFILNHVGLSLSGKSLAEAIPECKNNTVGSVVQNFPFKDGEGFFAAVKSTMKFGA